MNKAEHLLTTLAEECAETAQAIGKALRFGAKDGHPSAKITNAQEIEKEFIEAMAVRDMLRDLGVLNQPDNAKEIYDSKKERVKKFMQYAKNTGALSS